METEKSITLTAFNSINTYLIIYVVSVHEK
jgi:hypothetical protein